MILLVVEGLQFDVRHLVLSVAHRQEWFKVCLGFAYFTFVQFKENGQAFEPFFIDGSGSVRPLAVPMSPESEKYEIIFVLYIFSHLGDTGLLF